MSASLPTRPLGTDELQVSVVGLGCNNFGRPGFIEDVKGTDAVLGACLDHGVTFLDTAALYGGPESKSEELMGKALKGKRDQVVLATKFGHESGSLVGEDEWGPRGSRGYIRKSVEGSLRRLQTDWIDLFQHHSPDLTTPVSETIDALEELVDEGKIRFYGNSNYSAELLREADEYAKSKGVRGYVSAQDEYSLLKRAVEAGRLPAARELGLGFLPYFPLASGVLTGKYREDFTPEGTRLAAIPARLEGTPWAKIEKYRSLCNDLGHEMVHVSIAWLLAQEPVSSVIAGATKAEQVAQNAAAAQVELSDDVVAEISEIFS